MKKHWICRILALTLALMLALPCLAMAEEEDIVLMAVDPALNEAGEITMDLPGEEGGEAPAEAPAEQPAEQPAEAPAEQPAEAPAEQPAEAPAEQPAEEPAAETVEVNVDQAFEAAAEAAMDLPVEEAAPTAEAAPVGDAAVVVDDAAAVESQKGAANGPTSVAIDASQGNEFYLGMGPIQLTAVLQPPEAQTTLKWKSSKKKVAKVNAAGVLTPRKAGTSKITVTTGNKKKSSIKVTIRKNIIDNINPKPTRAIFNELGRNFVFYPKSVERTAGGKYVCKFYLVNGVGSSRSVNNIGLKLYVGDTLIGQKTVKRVKVRCAKGRSKVFKITFGPQDLLVADPMLLPQYGAEKILFQLTTNPSMTYVVRR